MRDERGISDGESGGYAREERGYTKVSEKSSSGGNLIKTIAIAVGIIFLLGLLGLGTIFFLLFKSDKADSKIQVRPGIGKETMMSQARSLAPFKAVRVGGALDMEINCGESEQIQIMGDTGSLSSITAEVSGDVLEINGANTGKGCKVKVFVPQLEELEISGAVSTKINNVKNHSLSIQTSGAGEIYGNGSVEELEVEVSGAGKINLQDLIAKNVEVKMSGASAVTVYAQEEIDAQISGAGSLDYYGDPKKVHKEISGIGTIQSRGK